MPRISDNREILHIEMQKKESPQIEKIPQIYAGGRE